MAPTATDLKLAFVALKSHYTMEQKEYNAKAENFLSKLYEAHISKADQFELDMAAKEVIRNRNFAKAAKYLEIQSEYVANNAYFFEARDAPKELLDILRSIKCSHLIFRGQQYDELVELVERKYKKEWKSLLDELPDLVDIKLIKLCQPSIDDETASIFIDSLWPQKPVEAEEPVVAKQSDDLNELLRRINDI